MPHRVTIDGCAPPSQQAFGLQGLLPPSAAYRFELELAEADGQWRVTAASWQPAGPPGG